MNEISIFFCTLGSFFLSFPCSDHNRGICCYVEKTKTKQFWSISFQDMFYLLLILTNSIFRLTHQYPGQSDPVGYFYFDPVVLYSPPFLKNQTRIKFVPDQQQRLWIPMIHWSGVSCCLSATAFYFLGRSSGRFVPCPFISSS